MKKNLRLLLSGTLAASAMGMTARFALAEGSEPEPMQPGELIPQQPDVTYALPGGSFSDVTITNGSSALTIAPNGDSIWDFDAQLATAGDRAQLRFFRQTLTTGVVSLFIYNGLKVSSVLLAGNGPSYFRNLVGFGTDTPQYKMDVQTVGEARKNTENRLVNVDSLNSSYDTTSGALTANGYYSNVHSSRSAGAGILTNVGVYASADSGDVNYAALFDKGDVRVNGHTLASGASAAVAGCGTSAAVNGDDKAGTVTEGTGATGCSVTFAAAYTAAPACVVRAKSGLGFTYDVTATGITITNVGALAGTKIDYVCRAI